MENSTQAQINASEQTSKKEVRYPLTANDKFEFIESFEAQSQGIAIVGLMGVHAMPRSVLEKTVSLAMQALVTAKVLIMHYSEKDEETMALINAENEKRKAEDAEKKAAETKKEEV